MTPLGLRALALATGLLLANSACAPGTAAPSPAASPFRILVTPAPTRTPIPTVAPGFGRIRGTVTSGTTHDPLEDVCVVIGPGDCQDVQPHTDEAGQWLVDLPVGDGSLRWEFHWVKEGYEITAKELRSQPAEQVVDLELKRR